MENKCLDYTFLSFPENYVKVDVKQISRNLYLKVTTLLETVCL